MSEEILETSAMLAEYGRVRRELTRQQAECDALRAENGRMRARASLWKRAAKGRFDQRASRHLGQRNIARAQAALLRDALQKVDAYEHQTGVLPRDLSNSVYAALRDSTLARDWWEDYETALLENARLEQAFKAEREKRAKLEKAAAGMADALQAYFNKRGAAHALRKGNEDIEAMADALAEWGMAEQKILKP
jgi:hypothetical protein